MHLFFIGSVNMLKAGWLCLFLFLFSGFAQAVNYSFSGSSFPTCSNGSWSQSGSTWTCNGSFTLNSGDTINPASSLTILAAGGMTFTGSNTVGNSINTVNLQTSWGNIAIGGTSTIYGSLNGGAPISLSNTTVTGSIATTGSINLSAGNITGNVSGSNGVTSTAGTIFGGSITSSNGPISVAGGSVAGNVSGGNGVTSTNATVFGGSVTSPNGYVIVSGGSVAGNVSGNGVTSTNGTLFGGTISSPNNPISLSGGSVAGNVSGNGVTTTNTTLSNGVASNNSALSISGGTIAGTIAGNGIAISNATMTSGSVTSPNSAISITNSLIGSASAAVTVTSYNVVNLTNSTTVYGSVTAGNWPTALNIDSTSRVYGVCSPGNVRCQIIQPIPQPIVDWHMDDASWSGSSGEVKDSSGNGFNGTSTSGNATTFSGGKICRGGVFNGINADVQVANSTTLNTMFLHASGLSFSIWAQAKAYATAKLIQRADWNGHGLGLDLWQGWQTSFYINGNSYVLNAGSRPTLNQWYHIVGTYDGSNVILYVNGVQVASSAVTGALTTNAYPVIAGSTGNSKYFNGLLDEAHVFPVALSAGQVNTLYANELAGKNWDGTNRICPAPTAEWRMDQLTWNGTSGEVLDSSGNGFNATANAGAATTSSGVVCRDGSFNGSNWVDAGTVNYSLNNAITFMSWVKWGIPPASGNSWADILTNNSTAAGDTGQFWLAHSYGNAHYEVDITNNNVRYTAQSLSIPTQGVWQHVAGTWDGTTNKLNIYVNGSLEATTSTYGSTFTPFVSTFDTSMGRWSYSGNNYRYFNGQLDEVKIFSTALNASQIASIYNNELGGKNWDGSVRACSTTTGPDHILITHDGNGVTCTPETLTITACANSACSSNFTSSPVTGNVTWAGAPGGTVPFSITSGGTTTISLPVTTVQTVTLATSAVNPAPSGSTVTTCTNTLTNTTDTGNSCKLPFAGAGLLFSSPNNLVSGTPQNVTVSAVRSSNNASNCIPAFSGVSRAINLKCTYTNPASGTLPAIVGGTSLNAGNSPSTACDGTGYSPTLSFNSAGVATTTLQYNDAGSVALVGTYSGSAATGDSGLTMTGSGSLVASPAKFGFTNITPPPIKAGNNFSATVTALNSAGSATPNFGKEVIPESASLTFTKCQPGGAGSTNGIFSGNVGAFSNGIANGSNLNWSDVGNGDLIATLTSGNYLNSGMTASGNTGNGGTVCNGAGNVGRFIPDHFDTAVITSASAPIPCGSGIACPIAYNGIVYSAQPFSVSITAKNATDATTTNYDSTLGFSKSVTLSALGALGTTTPPTGSGILGVTTEATFASGTYTETAETYTFTTSPTLPTNIYLRATDTDGVSSLSSTNPTTTSIEGGVAVVSGRLRISNAYGSELLPLAMTATAQLYNSSGSWVTSATDSLTTFNTATNLVSSIVKGPLAAVTVRSPGTVTLNNGVSSFMLNAPGNGNAGSAIINLNSPAYLAPLAGQATFGIYKGNNSIIYMRENY